MKEHIDTITDLLLGAAYADKRLEGEEVASISRLLCTLLGVDDLPDAQKTRLKSFNPAKFSVEQTAGKLAPEPPDRKRRVLELIASVNESDDVTDLDEDAYLRRVAQGMGMSADEIDDLTVDVLEAEEISHLLDD